MPIEMGRAQLANQTKHSSLPSAELNPLLNPLLAKNMGRWAEVYFNAVPELREEAVHELLRELEAEEARQVPADATRESERNSFARNSSQPVTQEPSAQMGQHFESIPALVCPVCGHENAASQRFCGMCGGALQSQTGRIEDSESLRHREHGFIASEPSLRSDYGTERSSYSYPAKREYESYEERNDDDQNLDRMFALTPSYSHSYRIVIAAAVAIIAVVLVFVAWRSGQATRAIMRLTGQTPPAAAEQQSSQSQNTNTAQNTSAQPTSTPNNAAPEQAQPPASAQSPQPNRPPKVVASARDTTGPEKSPVVAQAASATSNDTGTEELATAQRYLNGQQADRAEAAQWLWKSVAKRNLEATLLLSDLYLHGDGVTKNCDQARILLDAAATRGSKEAGVRLSHLQAFGCQ
jgi:Sec-independent protein translocase protein TatA